MQHVKLGELRALIKEELVVLRVHVLMERETNLDRAEKVADLVRATIRDSSKVQSLFSYLRQIKVPDVLRQQLLDLLKKGNNVEIVAATRDLACDTLGVRPSMTGSGEPDACRPRHKQGKRAQLMGKVKGFFGRN